MEKGGEKAGVGRFQQAGLDENKSLHMKTPTATGGAPIHTHYPNSVYYTISLCTDFSSPNSCSQQHLLLVKLPRRLRNQENQDMHLRQWIGKDYLCSVQPA